MRLETTNHYKVTVGFDLMGRFPLLASAPRAETRRGRLNGPALNARFTNGSRDRDLNLADVSCATKSRRLPIPFPPQCRGFLTLN